MADSKRFDDLTIDLGNNNTLISDDHTLLLSQPSCIVLNHANNSVEAFGESAYQMLDKVHGQLRSVRPLTGGVISDGESAGKYLRMMVDRVRRKGFFTPRLNNLISGVPYDTTEVERGALRRAMEQFNPHRLSLLFEPLAAAIGMGLDIKQATGRMIVDIGGGITEVVVISLGGIVTFQSTKVAGETLDTLIQDHLRKNHHLDIGLKTAESIKIQHACAYAPFASTEKSIKVTGKDRREGIPSFRMVSEAEICYVLNEAFEKIEQCVHNTLFRCPPELSADIFSDGIFITGGNAQIRGISERFAKLFGIPVKIDEHPMLSVSKGLSAVVGKEKLHRSLLIV